MVKVMQTKPPCPICQGNEPSASDTGAPATPDQTTPQALTGAKAFHVQRLLGRGAFGSVFLSRNKQTNEVFAIKVMNKRYDKKRWIFAERENLTLVDSPFVPKLHYAFQTDRVAYLVMDFICGQSFEALMRKNPKGLAEEKAKRYLSQMILAVKHLHDRDISHRDLKLENMMLTDGGWIRLVDFGYSTRVATPAAPTPTTTCCTASATTTTATTTTTTTKSSCSSLLPAFAPPLPEPTLLSPHCDGRQHDGPRSLKFTAVGTPLYAPPETILHASRGYDSKKVDLWSLGVILFEMLVGTTPFTAENYTAFKSLMRAYEANPQSHHFPWPSHPILPHDHHSHPSEEAKDLVLKLLCPDPSSRLTLSQVQSHPFFRGVVWEDLELEALEAEKKMREEEAAARRAVKEETSKNQPRLAEEDAPSGETRPVPTPSKTPVETPKSEAGLGDLEGIVLEERGRVVLSVKEHYANFDLCHCFSNLNLGPS